MEVSFSGRVFELIVCLRSQGELCYSQNDDASLQYEY